MLFNKTDKLENKYLFYITLCVVVYIIGSITVPLMEIDSVQYANISREMLLNKSFLQIFDQGKDYLDKPPMLFWVSSLSMYFFGINDIAFRLPSILMALLAIYSTYKFTMLYYAKEIALLASLVLASSQAMFLITHDLRTDTMLMAWVILGIWQFSNWLFTKKWISLIMAFVAVAFGMMTKGPIALMVPIFSFVPHILIHRNFKLLFKWEYLVGVFIILVLLIPMDIGLYQQFDLHPEKIMYEKTGTSGLRFFYWTQSFGRITGESVWHENDYFTFLFENLLWGFLPWILFFIIGLGQEFYTLLKNKLRLQSHEEWISLPGFLITYTALGISHYQLPHYIYVVLPFASIIAAKSIYSLITVNENKILKNSISVINAILFSLVLIILVVLLVIPFKLNYYTIIITLFIFLTIFWYSNFTQKIMLPKTIQFALFTILIANLLLNVFFYPTLLEYQLGNSVTKYIQTNKIDKKNFYLYKIYGERSLDFYSNHSFKIVEDANTLKKADYLLIANKLINQDLLTKYDAIKTISAFHVSTLNAAFLNPQTRDKALNYYTILQKK
jgi:4-amino-4-deoxy-L-arabinose transferase-like glycosyltransferase